MRAGIMLLLLGTPALGGEEPAVAPFYDGMVLTYVDEFRSPRDPAEILRSKTITYHVRRLDDETFKIAPETVAEQGKLPLDEYTGSSPADQELLSEFVVHRNGLLVHGPGVLFPETTTSFLWLPPEMRREGTKIFRKKGKIDFRRGWVVTKRRTWKGVDVWPVTFRAFLSNKTWDIYYDSKTGVLVGWESNEGKVTLMLVNTNFETLRQSMPRDGETR